MADSHKPRKGRSHAPAKMEKEKKTGFHNNDWRKIHPVEYQSQALGSSNRYKLIFKKPAQEIRNKEKVVRSRLSPETRQWTRSLRYTNHRKASDLADQHLLLSRIGAHSKGIHELATGRGEPLLYDPIAINPIHEDISSIRQT